MPFRRRSIAREMVTAAAVAAIYILVLLAPLHQAAGLQRDLAQLGYAPLDGWSICSSLAPQNEDGKPPAVVKCAAAGIGKHELSLPEPAVFDFSILSIPIAVFYADAHLLIASTLDWPSGQPRAPPAA